MRRQASPENAYDSRCRVGVQPPSFQGLITDRPAAWKGFVSRVATMNPFRACNRDDECIGHLDATSDTPDRSQNLGISVRTNQVERQHATGERGQHARFQIFMQSVAPPACRQQCHAGTQFGHRHCRQVKHLQGYASIHSMTRTSGVGRSGSETTLASSRIIQNSQHGPGFCRARPQGG